MPVGELLIDANCRVVARCHVYPPTTSAVECPVCCDDIEEGQLVAIFACCHQLHAACARDAVLVAQGCPVCRHGSASAYD